MHPLRMCQSLLIALAFALCAALPGSALRAQAAGGERLTFVAAKAPKSIVDGDRLTVTLNRWSTDHERDTVFSALNDKTGNGVQEALRDVGNVGYLRWPGGLEYSLRYARRVPRSDGSTDVLLITDRPVWIWWDSSVPGNHSAQFGLVQIRVGKDGVGQGRVATPDAITAEKAAGLMISNYETHPVLLTDVRRVTS